MSNVDHGLSMQRTMTRVGERVEHCNHSEVYSLHGFHFPSLEFRSMVVFMSCDVGPRFSCTHLHRHAQARSRVHVTPRKIESIGRARCGGAIHPNPSPCSKSDAEFRQSADHVAWRLPELRVTSPSRLSSSPSVPRSSPGHLIPPWQRHYYRFPQ